MHLYRWVVDLRSVPTCGRGVVHCCFCPCYCRYQGWRDAICRAVVADHDDLFMGFACMLRQHALLVCVHACGVEAPYALSISHDRITEAFDHAQEGALVGKLAFCCVHKCEVSVEAPESVAHDRAFEGLADFVAPPTVEHYCLL